MIEQAAGTGVEANRAPTAGDLVRLPVGTVEIHAHVAAAAYLMRRAGGGALVVTTDDAARKPIAVITEADIAQAVATGSDLDELRLADMVRRRLVSVQPTTALAEAAQIMLSSGLQYLTVVKRGRLFGLLHIGDVCRRLLVGTPVKPAATDFGLGIEARSRALLSEGEVAEGLFREAIERLNRTQLRTELARTHLHYGQWLRREGRRLQAIDQLRAAHDVLAGIGMDAFPERADRELMTTGEIGAHARRRDPRRPKHAGGADRETRR